jgi:hypothetical protein
MLNLPLFCINLPLLRYQIKWDYSYTNDRQAYVNNKKKKYKNNTQEHTPLLNLKALPPNAIIIQCFQLFPISI